MEIFVPRKMDERVDVNEKTLNSRLVSINDCDLGKVLSAWNHLEASYDDDQDPGLLLTSRYCETPVVSGTYFSYMLRPTLTIFGGAFEGKDKKTADIIMPLANEVGYLTAINGFNMRYGGGTTGLMGQALLGFLRGKADLMAQGKSYDDQYVVQVTIAHFMQPKSCNGNRPPNEGLSGDTDAVVILPGDMSVRKRLMRRFCETAILLPGAIGSPDERYDWIVHNKVGLDDRPLFVIDPMVPAPQPRGSDRRYYSHLERNDADVAARGMISREQLASFTKRAYDAKECMAEIMRMLAHSNRLPQDVYLDNKRRWYAPMNG